MSVALSSAKALRVTIDGLRRALFGGVAEGVLRRARVPILLVRGTRP